MRLAACLVVLALLSACGTTTPTPTATVEGTPNLAVTDEVSVISMTIEVPIAGTLVMGLSNVPAGGRPPVEFETIYFARSGGIAGQPLNIELRSDGTLIRDDETTAVSDETLTAMNDRLNRIDFYGLQGVFTGPVSSDAFSYDLTVASSIGSRTVSAQDGFTPPELIDLFNFISQLGD